MITKSLKKKYEFNKVYRRGKYKSGKYITLYYLENGTNKNRIGIVISRKAQKSSVKRNRLKRLVKEIYRDIETMFSGYDIIFLFRKNDILPNYSQVDNEIHYLLKSTNVLKEIEFG